MGGELVADHAHKTLDVARKTPFNIVRSVPATTHSNPLWFLCCKRGYRESFTDGAQGQAEFVFGDAADLGIEP